MRWLAIPCAFLAVVDCGTVTAAAQKRSLSRQGRPALPKIAVPVAGALRLFRLKSSRPPYPDSDRVCQCIERFRKEGNVTSFGCS